MTCGIYSITNKENGKMYIGQSIHIEQRFKEHVKWGTDNSYIDRAIKKHGEDAFDFDIVLECDESKLCSEEHKFIKLFGTYKKGYNLTWGGEIAISKSPEIRKKISLANKGKKCSEETKQKISKSRKGKCCGENHPMYGRHHSEETKEKLRQINLGKKASEETKKKQSEALKGRIMSEEHYWKLIDGNKNNPGMKGKHHSLKHNIEMSKINNSSGIFRVNKSYDYTTKQGFLWQYSYYDDNVKRKHFRRIDLNKLREEALKRGLDWIVIDEDKAKENGLL